MGRDMCERYRIDVWVVYDKSNITRQFSKARNDEQNLRKRAPLRTVTPPFELGNFVKEIITHSRKRITPQGAYKDEGPAE